MSIFATEAAARGENVPDYAAEELARLDHDFANLEADVSALLAEARKLPATVDDRDTAEQFSAIIARFKDLDVRIEGLREFEKMPHLRRSLAVDSFFFGKRERLLRRKKTDKAGGGDVLHERLHAYNVRRLEEEKRIRDEAERVARAAEAKLRQEREEAERQQREATEKSARARKQENIEAAQAAAAEAQARADDLAAREEAARAERQAAQDAAAAKPADMVRERHETTMNTMRLVWQVTVEDEMKLDAVKLWAFVSSDAKEKAARAWCKVTQHKQPMDGLRIEQVPDTQVRR